MFIQGVGQLVCSCVSMFLQALQKYGPRVKNSTKMSNNKQKQTIQIMCRRDTHECLNSKTSPTLCMSKESVCVLALILLQALVK